MKSQQLVASLLLVAIGLVALVEAQRTCAHIKCESGRSCDMIHGRPVCLCNRACGNHYKPVCGSDRITYNNECVMLLAACEHDEVIKKLHNGRCEHHYHGHGCDQ